MASEGLSIILDRSGPLCAHYCRIVGYETAQPEICQCNKHNSRSVNLAMMGTVRRVKGELGKNGGKETYKGKSFNVSPL